MEDVVRRIRREAKIAASRLVNRCVEWDLNKETLFIFTMRRSGSTLLMRMIYSQPNITYISQPHIHQDSSIYSDLVIPSARPGGGVKSELDDFIVALLNGTFRKWSQWNILDEYFSTTVNRLVVKLFGFNNVIDYISDYYTGQSIYLVRHPVAVARSIINKGWEPRAELHIEAADLREDRKEFADHILTEGSKFQKCVLEWVLANLHPLVRSTERNFLLITYEKLVSEPRRVAEIVCNHFDLPNPVAMEEVASSPTPTAVGNSRSLIQNHSGEYLVTRWVDEVPDRYPVEARTVLAPFGIELYNTEEPWPNRT